MSKFIERSHLSAMNLKVYFFCILLCLSAIIGPTVAGRKTSSNSRRGGSKPQQPPQYANPNIAQLSYGGNQPAQSISRPQLNSAPPQPSAPVGGNANSRPIGWNVDSPAVAANKPPVNANPPYPVNNQPGAPPPPYSQMPNQGPPPAYSPYPNPNVPNRFNEQPPAYNPSQGGFGAPHSNYPQQPQPGFGAGGYPQQPGVAPGSYPAQPGFGGAPAGFPNGAAPGGYPSGGFNQPPVNYQPQGGQGGSGLSTALLAGGGGLLIGGLAGHALSGSSDPKTIIINNTVVQAPENASQPVLNATETVLATTPVPLAAYPVAGNPNPSVNIQSVGSSEMIPLATYTPPGQVPSEQTASSTGLYPALQSQVNTGSGVAIELTTAVPLAPFPVTNISQAAASSQPQGTTPSPFALASLNSQGNTVSQESSQKSSAYNSFNTIHTLITCLIVTLPSISRIFLF